MASWSRAWFVAWVSLGAAAATAQTDGGAGTAPPPGVVDPPAALVLGAPTVDAMVSPSEVRLGERMVLIVTAVHRADVAVSIPEPLSLGDLVESAGVAHSRDKRSDGMRVREWQIELRAWELGDLVLGPVPVTYVAGGQIGTVSTPAVPVRVLPTLANADDASQLRGDAPPLMAWRADWVTVVSMAGLGLVVLVAVLWRHRHRRRPVESPKVESPSATPPRSAMDELALVAASPAFAENHRDAYVAMAEVIRRHLDATYGVGSVHATTGELLQRLAVAPSSVTHAALRWFSSCDAARYGNAAGSTDPMATLEAAKQLVVAARRPLQNRPDA